MKKLAKGSNRTKRARQKPEEKRAKQEAKITDAAIDDTIEKIHKWIAMHSMGRVILKDKEIHLFDQNQNAALLSKKVQKIIQKISKDPIS